jgi:hypothetical protein
MYDSPQNRDRKVVKSCLAGRLRLLLSKATVVYTMVQDGGAGAPGQARSTDRKALEPSTSDFRRGGLGPGGQGGPGPSVSRKPMFPFKFPSGWHLLGQNRLL